MHAEMVRMALDIQREDPKLARQMLDAASRTVSNLEDAIRCWEQMTEQDLVDDADGEDWKRGLRPQA